MRFACDTGGTFTDLIVEDGEGGLHLYKAPTIPADPVQGVIDALSVAAEDFGLPLGKFLAQGEMLIHGTTHAINAIITGRTAKTALMVTEGHPDILVMREGGRARAFDYSKPFPKPYIPRALTFEIPERMLYDGSIRLPLDKTAARATIAQLPKQGIEAVAVGFLWSTINPAHELEIARLLEEMMPGVPYTLSHRLNPCVREYRRISAAAIDVSLKPLMGKYLGSLSAKLSVVGFAGKVYVLTSQGGMMDAGELAKAPIHAINSGPSMAPIAGRHYVQAEGAVDNAIIADTGGTTYDISLVRDGRIPFSQELWIGEPYTGHMTGFPSVDVRSIGAGGGSIAWVDEGGMLHVGPKSAGADPGPACYGKGSTLPTLTDACLTLGYIDADYFLGGKMRLDVGAAEQAITSLGKTLKLDRHAAAAAVVDIATENMVQAIMNITVNQGVDPAQAVLVGGGGAAGLNSVKIARRLGCHRLLIPEVGAALSAAGALISDLTAEYRATHFALTGSFDHAAATRVLAGLETKCQAFVRDAGHSGRTHTFEFAVEARYRNQVWEIEVPLIASCLANAKDLAAFIDRFHRLHEQIFAIADPDSEIEVLTWIGRVRCSLRESEFKGRLRKSGRDAAKQKSTRQVFFPGRGLCEVPVFDFDSLTVDVEFKDAAIVESAVTTVVIDPGCKFRKTPSGNLLIEV